LTQFNLYLNRLEGAEQLRETFIAHGRKMLVVTASGDQYSVDFGELAQQVTHLNDENLVEATLRQWMIPETTTTQTDRIAASAIMLANFRQYFETK